MGAPSNLDSSGGTDAHSGGGVAAGKSSMDSNKDPAAKSAHLLWSPGFMTKTVSTLATILTAAWLLSHDSEVRFYVEDAFSFAQHQLLVTAHRFAWWTVIGLLSSACCAIQIILNAFSLGCAGFNTVLGPVRPHFMALTIVLQGSMWYSTLFVARTPMIMASVISTAVAVVLTLMPELLFIYSSLQSSGIDAAMQAGTAHRSSNRQAAVIQLPTLGCISCVTKVQAVLEKLGDDYKPFKVSLESGTAHVSLPQSPNFVNSDLSTLLDALSEGGFKPNVKEVVKCTSIWPTMPSDLVEACGSTVAQHANDPDSTTLRFLPSILNSFAASIVAGLMSSSCCLIQLGINTLSVLGVAHLGCAGFNKVLGPLRQPMRVLTGLWLSGLWLLACTSTRFKRPLTSLALRTCLTLLLTFLPEILVCLGGPALAPPVDSSVSRVLSFNVDGMGCEACATHVKSMLDSSSGVISSTVDLDSGVAQVVVVDGWGTGFNLTDVNSRMGLDGFELQTRSDV